MKRLLILPIIVVMGMLACGEKPSIQGLWMVTSVQVGDEEMTPNARWMQFHADSTQQSGNGFFQHSYGSWSLNQNKLSTKNTNGLTDSYGPFTISYHADTMRWERIEDEQLVIVKLRRIEELPQTYADQLLGLWKLEQATSSDNYFSESVGPSDYLFIRWDKRFVLHNDSGRFSGMYHVNGHRPRLIFIPNDEEMERSYWEIDAQPNQLKLKKLGTDSLVERRFSRIYEFPG